MSNSKLLKLFKKYPLIHKRIIFFEKKAKIQAKVNVERINQSTLNLRPTLYRWNKRTLHTDDNFEQIHRFILHAIGRLFYHPKKTIAELMIQYNIRPKQVEVILIEIESRKNGTVEKYELTLKLPLKNPHNDFNLIEKEVKRELRLQATSKTFTQTLPQWEKYK